MADIKRILNKKGWTGRELGIVEVTSMATAFANALSGKPAKPLVEEAEFMKMLDSLTDRTQAKIYRGYISIHEWLSIFYNVAQANLQQAQLQFKSISAYIVEAEIAETVYRYIESLPLIMTQQQYEEAVEKGRKKYLNGEDGTGRAFSVLNLIYYAMEYYINLLTKEPKKANPLKPIRKKYLSALVESQLIRSRYNEATGYGYYTLEDGRRSDQMSEEEWKKAIATPQLTDALNRLEQTGGLLEETYFSNYGGADIAENRILKRARVLFNGGTEKDAEEAQERLTLPCEWHYYEEAPEDLNKWEILEDSADCYTIFKKSLGGKAETPEEYIEETKAFVEEFKEAVEVIIADIDSRYFKGVKGFAELPIEEWETTIFSWTELYNKDFYGFKTDTNQDFVIFDGNKRVLTNGIAIIRPSDFLGRARGIDENGNYIPPKVINKLASRSLESFFPEAEDYADRIEEIKSGREALLDSYYFLKGYNLTIDLIAAEFDLPAIEVFKENIEGIETKIDAINELIPIVYREIRNTNYEDEELKQKKLQVLKDIFPEIDYKSIAIPEENITTLKESFKNFKAFKDRETITNLVCYRPHKEKWSEE